MNFLFKIICAAIFVFIAGAVQAGALVEEQTMLDVRIGGRPYKLDALIVRPADANGKLPIALLTHGRSADKNENAKLRANRMIGMARDFAHRGWLAVSVVRRGFGLSTGQQVRGVGCEGDYFEYFDANARDLAAALDVIGQRPDADATRVVAVGVSIGGPTVLAFGARHPKGLRAVVNISGGIRSKRNNKDCETSPALYTALQRFATRSKEPTLWLYSENDSYFPPDIARKMQAAYTKGGGTADFHMLPALEKDGHFLSSRFEGRKLWLRKLDDFLRAQALPTWPAERKQAAVETLRLPANLQPLLESYFAAPAEKALAISHTKRRGSWFAGEDIAKARTNAVTRCEDLAKEPCVIVMENFDLVGGATSSAAH